MSVGLINCPSCGHIVATDAICCPQCGTREFLLIIARQREKEHQTKLYEQIELPRQKACLRVREEIKKHGKLYLGTISLSKTFVHDPHYDFSLCLDGEKAPDDIDGTVRRHYCFSKSTIQYSIIPYGVHRISISIRRHQSDSRCKTHRWHDNKYTDCFEVTPNDSDVIRVCAYLEGDRPWHHSLTGEERYTFKEYSIREERLDFTRLKKDQILYLNQLCGNTIDISEYRWPVELDD